MAPIKVPSNLPELVKTAFSKARNSGDLTYYPTQVTLLQAGGTFFQLRYSPALASKPRVPSTEPAEPSKPFDPFENPSGALLVTDELPGYNLVLNKFAVVPEHFILATKENKPQTGFLDPEDLAATFACIESYVQSSDGGGQELFAFFNSGEHSGASQPHRHVQLLPVERMREGLDGVEAKGTDGKPIESDAWEVLAERLIGQAGGDFLPFKAFAEKVKPSFTADDLHRTYAGLYARACQAVDRFRGKKVDLQTDERMDKGRSARISYNLALTRHIMVIAPRLAEGAKVRDADDKDVGSVALNGTVLAGTALVKNEAEWEALRKDPGQLARVLSEIGIPSQEQEAARKL